MPSTRRLAPFPVVLALFPLILALSTAACSSSYREEMKVDSVEVPLPAAVTGVRILLPMGDIILEGDEVDPTPSDGAVPDPGGETGMAGEAFEGRTLRFEGNGYRTAATEAGLERLRAVSMTLRVDSAPDENGVLTLRGPELPAGLDASDHVVVLQLRIRCPPGLAVEIELLRGSFDVRRVEGPLNLDTGYGQIHLRHVHGDAVLRTNHGNVTVDHHRGGVDLEIDVGAVMLWIDELGQSTVRAVTREGNVNVRLDPSEVISVDARTELGRVMNTFGIPIESMGKFGAKMVGTNGMRGGSVILRTERGHVALEKRARTGGG